jgi:hypothetical protein
MKKIISLIVFALSLFAIVFERGLQAPPTVSAVVSLFAIVSALVVAVIYRSEIVATLSFEKFTAGQMRVGIFALICFLVSSVGYSAANIQDRITSLVIRPSGTRNSDTNGLIRLYSANESNFFAITTNLDFVFSTPNGVFTGITASRIFTNEASARVTNSSKSGLLMSTNGVQP